MKTLPRILFAGGCHLTGFPVGPELSLVRVALQQIQHPDTLEPQILGYANLLSGERIAEACKQIQPRILVLQVGHYETLPKLKKMLRLGGASLSTSSSFKVPSPSAHASPSRPDARFASTLSMRTVFARRAALGWMLRKVGLGNRVFDADAIELALEQLLSQLTSLPLDSILLLSPFSCPDPLTRSNRRQAAPLFAQAASRHGCIFVDAFTLLEEFGQGPRFDENFADPNHLSRLGHQRVGRVLGQALSLAIGDRG